MKEFHFIKLYVPVLRNTIFIKLLQETELINDEPIPKRVKLDVNETYLWH